MAEEYQRPYLESSAFIAWIKGEVVDGVDRGDVIDHILKQAAAGKFSIFSSTVTIAEVHKVKGGIPLSEEQSEQIVSSFAQDFFRLIDVDRKGAEEANRLARTLNLNPMDAIHLACALRVKCDYLLTWDTGLLKVKHPDITVEKPAKKGQLNLEL